MRTRIATIPVILVGLVAVLAVVEQGGARSAESVACSSVYKAGTANLTGNWSSTTSDLSYDLWQNGSCLWWVGGKKCSTVFFGSVFGSTVTGVWADTFTGDNGTLTLSFTSDGKRLTRRGSAGDAFPGRSWTMTDQDRGTTCTSS
jgi:hypothetical protein